MLWSVILITIVCFQASSEHSTTNASSDCITNALKQLNAEGDENSTIEHTTGHATPNHDNDTTISGKPEENDGCTIINNYSTPNVVDCNCHNSSQETKILEKVDQIHDQLLEYSKQTNIIQHNCSSNCAQKSDLDRIEERLITTIKDKNIAECDCATKSEFSQIKRNRRTRGKYVGCYDSKKEPRGSVRRCKSNTMGSCIDICYRGHYVYAELQNGDWCFCGNRMEPANKLPESSCSVHCSGNYSQICGANHIKSVYETGIEEYLINEEGFQLSDSYLAPSIHNNFGLQYDGEYDD